MDIGSFNSKEKGGSSESNRIESIEPERSTMVGLQFVRSFVTYGSHGTNLVGERAASSNGRSGTSLLGGGKGGGRSNKGGEDHRLHGGMDMELFVLLAVWNKIVDCSIDGWMDGWMDAHVQLLLAGQVVVLVSSSSSSSSSSRSSTRCSSFDRRKSDKTADCGEF